MSKRYPRSWGRWFEGDAERKPEKIKQQMGFAIPLDGKPKGKTDDRS